MPSSSSCWSLSWCLSRCACCFRSCCRSCLRCCFVLLLLLLALPLALPLALLLALLPVLLLALLTAGAAAPAAVLLPLLLLVLLLGRCLRCCACCACCCRCCAPALAAVLVLLPSLLLVLLLSLLLVLLLVLPLVLLRACCRRLGGARVGLGALGGELRFGSRRDGAQAMGASGSMRATPPNMAANAGSKAEGARHVTSTRQISMGVGSSRDAARGRQCGHKLLARQLEHGGMPGGVLYCAPERARAAAIGRTFRCVVAPRGAHSLRCAATSTPARSNSVALLCQDGPRCAASMCARAHVRSRHWFMQSIAQREHDSSAPTPAGRVLWRANRTCACRTRAFTSRPCCQGRPRLV